MPDALLMELLASNIELSDHIDYHEQFDLGQAYCDSAQFACTLDLLILSTRSFIQSFSSIIFIVLITRILHHFIDAIAIHQQKSILYPISTGVLGALVLELYLRLNLKHGELNLARTVLLYSVLILYLPSFQHNSKDIRVLPNLKHVFIAFSPILVNEFLVFNNCSNLTCLRSFLMVSIMKSWSSSVKNFSYLHNLAELLHPSSSIFGPWKPNQRLHKSQQDHLKRQLLNFSICLSKAIGLLVLSDGLDLLANQCPETAIGSLAKVYLQSLTFRCGSHYFSSYVSMSFISLWLEPDESITICRIKSIELPRSSVQVVTSWNIPMHMWLKTFVFQPLQLRTSRTAIAIGGTYIVSSLLHGFKFHIWSVLLTLGLITWLEYTYRSLLSIKFDACIGVHKCTYLTERCSRGHRNTEKNSIAVRAFNLSCSLITIANLTYLGYIFAGNSDQESYSDALQAWHNLYFYSHIISFFGIISHKLFFSNQRNEASQRGRTLGNHKVEIGKKKLI